MESVKLVDRESGKIEGLAIPYGGPMPDDRDLDGEKFTKDTNVYLDLFDSRPILYNHAMDTSLGWNRIGTQTKASRRDKGIWAEAQMNTAHEYWDVMADLLGEGMLGFSSGAHGRGIAKTADGVITAWPWIELSLTPTPANPFAMVTAKSGGKLVVPVKSQAECYRKLGRLPDASEAEEWAGEIKQDSQDMLERLIALENRLKGKEPSAEKSDEFLAELRKLELEHQKILHGEVL